MQTRKLIPGNRSLRKGRANLHGQIYLITTCCSDRQPRFGDFWAAAQVARLSHDPTLWPHARLLCWMLMPDHWHGLVELHSGSISDTVSRFKACTSRAINAIERRRGALWQSGFHDHALRDDEDALACARYVIANPIRAGLVRSCRDWPFWNAVWL
ncbi:MAG: transposase [Pseudomonadota bacterium]|nr:transposase [Pseudomonadota bacterium]